MYNSNYLEVQAELCRLRAGKEQEMRERGDATDPAPCGYDCSGTGWGLESYPGECPGNCSQIQLTPAHIRKAKSAARLAAIESCQKKSEPNCLCSGGEYKELTNKRECIPFKTTDGTPFCHVFAYYEYSGKCKDTP